MIWSRPLGAECPTWELSLHRGWGSWLFGAQLERYAREWTLQLRLGPVGLWLVHVG